MKALIAVSILILHLRLTRSERFTLLSPDERNSRPGRVLFYRPIDDGKNSQVPWEEPLKQAVHLALHGANGVHDAPYVGAGEGASGATHRFGDVAVLARGKLMRTREGGYRFLENDKSNDCEDCHLPDVDVPGHEIRRRGNEDHNLAAIWTVRRVRHRDPVRGHRYELQFTITPIDNHLHNGDADSATERRFIVRDDDYPRYFRALTQHKVQQYSIPPSTLDERYRFSKLYNPGEDARRHPPVLNTNEYYVGDKPRDKYPLKAILNTNERIREPETHRVRFPNETPRDQRYVYRDQDEQELQQTRVRYGAITELDPETEDLRPFRKPKAPSHITHFHHHHYYIGKPDFQPLPLDPKLVHEEYIAHAGKYQQPNSIPIFVPNTAPEEEAIVKFPTSSDRPQPLPTYKTPSPIQNKLPSTRKPLETYHFQPEVAHTKAPVTFAPSEFVTNTKFSEPDPLYHNTQPGTSTTQIFLPTETSISEPAEEGYYVTITPEKLIEVNCTTNNLHYVIPTQLLPTHDYEETRTEPMQAEHVEIPRIIAESSRQFDTKATEVRSKPTEVRSKPTEVRSKPTEIRAKPTKSQILPPRDQSEVTIPYSTTTEKIKTTRGRVSFKLTTVKPTTVKTKWMPRRTRPKSRNRNNRIAASTTMTSFEVLDSQTETPSTISDDRYNIITLDNTTEMLALSDTKSTAFTENYNSVEISSTPVYSTMRTVNTLDTVEPLTSQSNSTSISFRVGNSTVINKNIETSTIMEINGENLSPTSAPGAPKIYEVFKNSEGTTIKVPSERSGTKYRKQRTKYRNTTEKQKAEDVTLDELTLSILNHARRESLLNKT